MPKAEKAAAVAADPVPRFRATLIRDGIAAESRLLEIESAIEKELDAAVEFAMASPFPDASDLTRDVYAEVGGT